jgi:antitoxin Xre/MbcA/ParS-like protein
MPAGAIAAVEGLIAGFSWDAPIDLSKKEVQARLSPPAIKGFFRLVRAWKLRDEDARQLLGGISNGAFYHLKGGKTKKLDQDQLTRVSLVLGIFKALNILYSENLADAWVSLPNTNPVFGGETPLAYMTRGGVPAMLRVRQLVDARRGGR